MSKFKENPRATVSDWVQSTLLKSKVSIAEIAAKLDKSQDLIYKFANRNAEQNIPAYAAFVLIAISGDYTILEELANLFGFELCPEGTGDELEKLRKIKEVLGG